MTPKPLATSWRDQPLELLRDRPRDLTYRTISNDTGLPETWILGFAIGRSDNPGVVYVETLFNYLSNRKA